MVIEEVRGQEKNLEESVEEFRNLVDSASENGDYSKALKFYEEQNSETKKAIQREARGFWREMNKPFPRGV